MVTRPHAGSGLGANLLSLVGALFLAERSGRDLIVDWTSMDALRDKDVNYFVAFFEPIARWRTVRILYANHPDSGADARYDASSVVPLSKTSLPAALAGALDASHLYLDAYHYYRVFHHCPDVTPSGLFEYTRAFYRVLRPRAGLAARIASARASFQDRIVVGLNVRTGNGHPTYQAGGIYAERSGQAKFGRADFMERVAAACHDCIATIPRELWPEVAIYVVTDEEAMQQRLVDLPRSFAVRTLFPPRGTGHSPAGAGMAPDYPDVEIIHQTIIDMFLLAECSGLVYNYSDYTRCPRYLTRFYNGNEKQLEHYFDLPARRLARRVVRWARHRRARLSL